ncbi:MAG: hypothetical protein KF862_04485 [Chitinophagaceae bacterium]|nr:hypothetical protein [Chitinophagaceae bacterium]
MKWVIIMVLLFVGFVVYRKEVSGIAYCKAAGTNIANGRVVERDGVGVFAYESPNEVLCNTAGWGADGNTGNGLRIFVRGLRWYWVGNMN